LKGSYKGVYAILGNLGST